MKRICVLGGGTFNHVRSHLALAAPAFGETARALKGYFEDELLKAGLDGEYSVELHLTKMADHESKMVTNRDVEGFLDELIADPNVKAIVFSVAMADFEGAIGDVESGKHADRMKTAEGSATMSLTPSEKVIGKIRRDRKDVFAVGFKTTTGASTSEQYVKALELLKKNSLNVVFANDVTERTNMVVVPEEARYRETSSRSEALKFLAKLSISRMRNSFTRSTVVEGEAVDWSGDEVPGNLREVVDHCVAMGAYKPFLGKTAGHFAARAEDGSILTSIRKTNFNDLKNVGLVKVEASGDDEVIAHGFKPSVGGQSQRIIFSEHPDLDCIVHFHSPVRRESREKVVPVVEQWPNECGSHECGRNTSEGLRRVDLGDGDSLSVVYLENHGPNVVFGKRVPAKKVIDFIDANFDLKAKTGGLV